MELTIQIRSPIRIVGQIHTNQKAQGSQHTATPTDKNARRTESTLQQNNRHHQDTQRTIYTPRTPAGHNVDTVQNSPKQNNQSMGRKLPQGTEGAATTHNIGVSGGYRQTNVTTHAHAGTGRQKSKLPKTKIVFLGVLLALAFQILSVYFAQINPANEALKAMGLKQLNPIILMGVSIGGLYTSICILVERYLWPIYLILILVAVIYYNGGI